MKGLALALVLCFASMTASLWFMACTHHSEKVFELETDRAWKGMRLQLESQGVHCENANN